MSSKEKLAELVNGLTELQAGPLLAMSQAYLQATRDAETKGRLEISNEVIKYLSDAAPSVVGSFDARPPAAPQVRPAIASPAAIVPPGQAPR
ncbi:MAG: hypothetical protein LBB75_04845 [Oscillospiraceae bacterium]|jgi:hypothetical protein|nr:hypothetical protein [Oscillospiraceae bacterium]